MKSRQILLLIAVLCCSFNCSAQKYQSERYSEYKVYRSLKKALKNKEDVKVLVLSEQELKEFPMEIIELMNLKVLNLTNNQIKQLPKEIENLVDLERLDMMKNNLVGLPKEITHLKKLRRINIAFNGLHDEDVAFVKAALPDCFIITQLSVE